MPSLHLRSRPLPTHSGQRFCCAWVASSSAWRLQTISYPTVFLKILMTSLARSFSCRDPDAGQVEILPCDPSIVAGQWCWGFEMPQCPASAAAAAQIGTNTYLRLRVSQHTRFFDDSGVCGRVPFLTKPSPPSASTTEHPVFSFLPLRRRPGARLGTIGEQLHVGDSISCKDKILAKPESCASAASAAVIFTICGSCSRSNKAKAPRAQSQVGLGRPAPSG
jgi:hypothetical protein